MSLREKRDSLGLRVLEDGFGFKFTGPIVEEVVVDFAKGEVNITEYNPPISEEEHSSLSSQYTD